MIISQSNSNSQNAEITEQNFWRLTTSTTKIISNQFLISFIVKPNDYFTIQLKFTKCWNNWAEFLTVNNFNSLNYFTKCWKFLEINKLIFLHSKTIQILDFIDRLIDKTLFNYRLLSGFQLCAEKWVFHTVLLKEKPGK